MSDNEIVKEAAAAAFHGELEKWASAETGVKTFEKSAGALDAFIKSFAAAPGAGKLMSEGVKRVAIGAGVGAGVGALTAKDGERMSGATKGALGGAALGTAVHGYQGKFFSTSAAQRAAVARVRGEGIADPILAQRTKIVQQMAENKSNPEIVAKVTQGAGKQYDQLISSYGRKMNAFSTASPEAKKQLMAEMEPLYKKLTALKQNGGLPGEHIDQMRTLTRAHQSAQKASDAGRFNWRNWGSNKVTDDKFTLGRLFNRRASNVEAYTGSEVNAFARGKHVDTALKRRSSAYDRIIGKHNAEVDAFTQKANAPAAAAPTATSTSPKAQQNVQTFSATTLNSGKMQTELRVPPPPATIQGAKMQTALNVPAPKPAPPTIQGAKMQTALNAPAAPSQSAPSASPQILANKMQSSLRVPPPKPAPVALSGGQMQTELNTPKRFTREAYEEMLSNTKTPAHNYKAPAAKLTLPKATVTEAPKPPISVPNVQATVPNVQATVPNVAPRAAQAATPHVQAMPTPKAPTVEQVAPAAQAPVATPRIHAKVPEIAQPLLTPKAAPQVPTPSVSLPGVAPKPAPATTPYTPPTLNATPQISQKTAPQSQGYAAPTPNISPMGEAQPNLRSLESPQRSLYFDMQAMNKNVTAATARHQAQRDAIFARFNR